MKCINTPCEWFWCQKNKKCHLHVIELGPEIDYSLIKQIKGIQETETNIFKTKRGKSSKVKKLLTPIVQGETIEDNLYECHYCQKELSYSQVTTDHKIPLVKGGKNIKSNVLPSCKECNQEKGSKEYKEFIAIRRKNLIKLR